MGKKIKSKSKLKGLHYQYRLAAAAEAVPCSAYHGRNQRHAAPAYIIISRVDRRPPASRYLEIALVRYPIQAGSVKKAFISSFLGRVELSYCFMERLYLIFSYSAGGRDNPFLGCHVTTSLATTLSRILA